MPPLRTRMGAGPRVRAARRGPSRLAIDGVAIEGDTVESTCAGPLPDGGLVVGYAMAASAAASPKGRLRWGQLLDSDPFVGAVTGTAQPNHCVAFELEVP